MPILIRLSSEIHARAFLLFLTWIFGILWVPAIQQLTKEHWQLNMYWLIGAVGLFLIGLVLAKLEGETQPHQRLQYDDDSSVREVVPAK